MDLYQITVLGYLSPATTGERDGRQSENDNRYCENILFYNECLPYAYYYLNETVPVSSYTSYYHTEETVHQITAFILCLYLFSLPSSGLEIYGEEYCPGDKGK